jgi:hypothetical protein
MPDHAAGPERKVRHSPPGNGWVPGRVGFLLVDSSGVVLSANAEALRIVHYSRALQKQAELKQIVTKMIGTPTVGAHPRDRQVRQPPDQYSPA